MRVLQRLYRTVLVLKDHFLESIIEVLVTSPEAEIIFIALLQVPNEPPIGLLVLTRPRARLVPDDARLLQTQVLILGRHAAEVAQQSEFPEIPDISGVPILHVEFTNTL